jgi:hypothetical protein
VGLSGQLSSIVPAHVTWAQAKAAWEFGLACAEEAVSKGSGFFYDDEGQTTRVRHAEALRAWGASFASADLGAEMDYANWDSLRTQIFGAASDLESLGEVNDAFWRHLDMLKTDLWNGAKDAVTTGTNVLLLVVAGAVVFLLLTRGDAV